VKKNSNQKGKSHRDTHCILRVRQCKSVKRHQTVKTTLDKVTNDSHLIVEQRKPRCSRLPEQVREEVRRHISKYPTVPSHYFRHTSTKQYLS